MRHISKLCLLATEYTIIYPWIPMKCLLFRIVYSSCPAVSMISTAKSVFLYRMILLNVFSMVGVVGIDEVAVDELDG